MPAANLPSCPDALPCLPIICIAFSELDALSGSKTSGCTTSPHLRFSNHGRSGGSQTTPPMARALGPVQQPRQIRRFSNNNSHFSHVPAFSNHGRSGGSQTDMQLLMSAMSVQQPWQIGRFSNLRKRRYGPRDSSATMADQVVLKRICRAPSKAMLFSNHGRSSGSQTCGCGYAV